MANIKSHFPKKKEYAPQIMKVFRQKHDNQDKINEIVAKAIPADEAFCYNMKAIGMADEIEYWLVEFLSYTRKKGSTFETCNTSYDNYLYSVISKYETFKKYAKEILSDEIAFAFADKFDELHDKNKNLIDALFVEFKRVNSVGVSFMLMVKILAELAEFFESNYNTELERRTGIVRNYYVQDIIEIKETTLKALKEIEITEQVCYKTKLSSKLINKITQSYYTQK